MTTEAEARRIVETTLGTAVQSCHRFPTGLTHWVYDVKLTSGERAVVRLCRPDNAAQFEGALFWHDHLVRVGVSVPKVLAADTKAEQPYLILERLAGTDLGNVFDDLTDDQLREVGHRVHDMQQRTARLPPAAGFGYALDYGSTLQPSWSAVLDASLVRSARRIEGVGVVDQRLIAKVAGRLTASHHLLGAVEPVAFLHDATTKNVIVHEGSVTGLVDTDEMAFGDPLWTVALTRMSLLSARRPTRYVDYLLAGTEVSDADRERLDLYTTLFCVGFLAELGQQFNQESPAPIDVSHQQHLEAVLESLT